MIFFKILHNLCFGGAGPLRLLYPGAPKKPSYVTIYTFMGPVEFEPTIPSEYRR